MPTTLRFSSKLHDVNWKNVISKEFPLATENKISNILHLSGKFAVSPLFLIAKVLIDKKKNLRYLTQGDADFNKNLASFANNLSTHDQEFHSDKRETKSKSSVEYALKKSLNAEGYIDDFISRIRRLIERYDLTEKTTMNRYIRRENDDIVLDLPFPGDECWRMGQLIFYIYNFNKLH